MKKVDDVPLLGINARVLCLEEAVLRWRDFAHDRNLKTCTCYCYLETSQRSMKC